MGYRIYFGTASGVYTRPVIDVGRVASYSLAGLAAGGTYYVALTAYDTSGNESGYSREITVTVPASDIGGGVPPNGGGSGCGGAGLLAPRAGRVSPLTHLVNAVVLWLPLFIPLRGRALRARAGMEPRLKESV
ncbi:MAG: hypothetical protein AB1515_03780 [Nitrospirota bacterium]